MARKRGKNSRLPKGVAIEGLTESLAEFKALPAATRRAMTSAINEQASATRNQLIDDISADGKVRPTAVRSRITVEKASKDQPSASLTLSRSPVPFKFWQYRTEVEDGTGTRASIWIRKGGQRMRVYGFVNPKGGSKTPLVRYRKGSQRRLTRANGWTLKNHWNHQVNGELRKQVAFDLQQRFLARLAKERAT